MKDAIKGALRWVALRQPVKGLVIHLVYPAIVAALRDEIQPDTRSPSGLAEAFAWKAASYSVLSEELCSGTDCGNHDQASQERLFSVVAESLAVEGDVLEFGVGGGHSVRLLACLFPDRRVYGFDSFQGLPETWWTRPKGAFGVDAPPQVDLPNVELVEGLFSETVPGFLDGWSRKAALIHVDCDLYASTIESLGPALRHCVPGTIITFDEYYNYPEFAGHEWRAWSELSRRYGIEARCIAYDSRRAAFEIVSIKTPQLARASSA